MGPILTVASLCTHTTEKLTETPMLFLEVTLLNFIHHPPLPFDVWASRKSGRTEAGDKNPEVFGICVISGTILVKYAVIITHGYSRMCAELATRLLGPRWW